jgi:hypothetical protein
MVNVTVDHLYNWPQTSDQYYYNEYKFYKIILRYLPFTNHTNLSSPILPPAQNFNSFIVLHASSWLSQTQFFL